MIRRPARRHPAGQPTTRHLLTVGLLRAAAATAVIVTAYFLLPLDRVADVAAVISLPVALAGFSVLMVVQVRAIVGSPFPGMRAVEVLAVSLPLFLVIFAATYYVMGVSEPQWFSESMSKLDALYFTVTVFATVGFGDITATSPPARLTVMVQMLADLVVLGLGVRVLTGAVREARDRSGRPLPGSG